MTHILAIDPGTTKSGWVYLVDGEPLDQGWMENRKLYTQIKSLACMVVIEDVTHMGMPVGRDVFETVRWTGRYDYLAREIMNQAVHYISRTVAKVHLCGTIRANDSPIRQAIIDRFGGDEVAIGGKKCKGKCKGKGWFGRDHASCRDCGGTGKITPAGVLHHISGHEWSALAVGLTAHDQLLINRIPDV